MKTTMNYEKFEIYALVVARHYYLERDNNKGLKLHTNNSSYLGKALSS